MAFKLRGEPMARNFGVGSAATKKTSAYPAKGDPVPGEELTAEQKKAAMGNAMGAAEKTTLSDATTEGMNKYFGGVNADLADVKLAIRKSSATEGNSDYVKAMRATAKARYPGQFK